MGIKVNLDDVLKQRGMTGKELCEKVGITEANMSMFRSGKVKGIRFHTLNRICYFLDCKIEDLLEFDGNLDDQGEKE